MQSGVLHERVVGESPALTKRVWSADGPPLQKYCKIDNAAFEDFSAKLSAYISPLTVKPASGRNKIANGRFSAFDLVDVRLVSMGFDDPVSILVDNFHDCYMLHVQLTGETQIENGDVNHAFRPNDAAVISAPGELRETLKGNAAMFGVFIKANTMDWYYEVLHHQRPSGRIVFPEAFPIFGPVGAPLLNLLDFIFRDVELDSALSNSAATQEHFRDLLLFSILTNIKHNQSSNARMIDFAYEKAAVRRAIQYMTESYAHEMSLSHLADVSGVSIWSLSRSFKKAIGKTPMQYLRDIRLDRVRHVLNTTQSLTVKEAARSCGITRFGNFSRIYRKRFGELPSETLKRR